MWIAQWLLLPLEYDLIIILFLSRINYKYIPLVPKICVSVDQKVSSYTETGYNINIKTFLK